MITRIADKLLTLGEIVAVVVSILGIGWLLFQVVNLAFRWVTGGNLL